MRPSLVGDELVADDLDRLDALVAEDRDRRDAGSGDGSPRLARRRARRVLAQDLDVALRAFAVRLERGLARRVELEVGGVDDDVGAGELAELLQLRRRERGLRRAAAAEHDDLAEAASRRSPRSPASVVSVGASSSGVSASIRATSSATLPLPTTTARSPDEVELELLEVGVAVVPGDELGGRPRAGQVLAGDPEPPVGLRADRVDDRVVEREQLLVRDVAADLDVAEEAEARAARRSSRTRARPP